MGKLGPIGQLNCRTWSELNCLSAFNKTGQLTLLCYSFPLLPLLARSSISGLFESSALWSVRLNSTTAELENIYRGNPIKCAIRLSHTHTHTPMSTSLVSLPIAGFWDGFWFVGWLAGLHSVGPNRSSNNIKFNWRLPVDFHTKQLYVDRCSFVLFKLNTQQSIQFDAHWQHLHQSDASPSTIYHYYYHCSSKSTKRVTILCGAIWRSTPHTRKCTSLSAHHKHYIISVHYFMLYSQMAKYPNLWIHK